MQFDLKSISTESIPKALEKVERYRLLNEPSLAESICLDILAVSPSHQQALVSLLWARQGHAHLHQRGHFSNANSYHALRQAMEHYEQAATLRPPGNDDAILRWNSCARVLMQNPEIRPMPDPEFQPITSE